MIKTYKPTLKKFTEKDYGFIPVVDVSGDWKKLYGIDYAIERVITLLSIIEGTYPWDPRFGVKLPLYIFEKLDDNIAETIATEIETKLSMYEKDFVLEDLEIYVDDIRKKVYVKCLLHYTPTSEDREITLQLTERGVFLPL